MTFKSDRQRKAAFANMNKGIRYSPPTENYMVLRAGGLQKTLSGGLEPIEPTRTSKKSKPEPIKRFDNVQVALRKDRSIPTFQISSAESAVQYVKEMEGLDREQAIIIHMDTKNKAIGKEIISQGSLNASIVHPRETLKGAVLNNSAGVIFVHNHPSGDPEPSQADLDITRKLQDTFRTAGIEMHDSIVIGRGRHYSLRENNLM